MEHGRHGGAANRGEDKSHTIPVGTDIYVCLPYTLTVKKKKKKRSKKKKERKKKEKRNRQSKNNQTKQSKEKNNLDVTPLGQSERAYYLRYFIKYVHYHSPRFQ